jgi:hypothetical protein
MPDLEEIKLAEDQFIARLRENINDLPGVGHVQADDRMGELRQETHGKLLRQELEAKYPLGKTIVAQVTPRRSGFFARAGSAVTLTGQVLVHLPRCIEHEGDDQPATVAQLHHQLNREARQRERAGTTALLGLFSPTGWDAAATQWARNDPPGSGWASGTVSVILIGPRVTDLVWDTRDARTQQYLECFCGLTRTERQDVCREKIERALLVQEFAHLDSIAQDQGFSLAFVKDVARSVTSRAKDRVLKKVSGVGWVVKKTN